MSLMACVWVPFFAAAAAERCEPALTERPLAIVRGAPPASRVVEANAVARAHKITPGITETEACARCSGLVRRAACESRVASARHALLEAALAVSPRLEEAAPGVISVDMDGLEQLFGGPRAIGERLVRHARAVGLAARVAVATSRAVARVVVQCASASVVVIPAGCERAALAPAPLTVLDLPEEVSVTLSTWGVRMLGELAALPRAGVAERLGPAGLRAYDLALGRDPDPFCPWVPPPFWEEAQELDWEIHELPALVTVVRAVLERLAGRLAAAHVAADALDVGLALADGTRHERTVALAYPSRDPTLMQALLRAELEAHPPSAAVTGVALSVHPVLTRPGQAGLWQPSIPAHRDLTGVLTRLVALVGDANIGSPSLLDSHRPDAVTLGAFSPLPEPREETGPAGAQLVLRRLRPPRRVEIVTDGERPARVHWGGAWLRVVTCAGPWRASGEWWDTRAWARDEWDLLLEDATLCRLARDGITGAWMLDGIYD